MRPLFLWLTLPFAVQDAEEVVRSGLSKAKKGDWEGAYQDFSRAVQLRPDDAAAYVHRARVSLERGKPDAALPDLDRAIELAPRSGVPYYLRGRARLDRGEAARAAADLTRALELGYRTPEVHKMRARCRDRLFDFAGAVDDYTHALHQTPSDPGAYLGRGYSRLLLSDLRGALVDLTDAIDLDPARGGPRFARGWGYLCLQSWDNALRDFRGELELGPRETLRVSLGVWIARVNLGEREAAAEELALRLRAVPKEHLATPFGQVAQYLLDLTPEAKLLEKHPVRAHFWIAARKSAEGDPEGALRSLRQAAEDKDVEGVAARLALRARQASDRRRTVESLEAKSQTLKSFHAEFELLCPSHDDDSKGDAFDPQALVVDGDFEARRFLLRIMGKLGDAERTAYLLLEGDSLTAWGVEGTAFRMDLAGFFKRVDGMFDGLFRELDRLAPPERNAKEAPRDLSLILNIDPKPSKDEHGTFRVAVAWAGRRFSWLSAVASSEGPDASPDGPLLTFELPRQKKKISVDEATGFLAGIEVADYDGKIRRLARRRFAARAEFPDLVVPAKPATSPVPYEQVQAYLQERHAAFGLRLASVLDRWDRLGRDRLQEEAKKLAASWAATWLDLWHAHLIRLAARHHLKAKLDGGETLEDLLKASDAELLLFKDRLARQDKELRSNLSGALANLRAQVREGLIALPIDSRRHGTLKMFLNEALDFDRVETERAKGDAEKIDRLFREELEARKRL